MNNRKAEINLRNDTDITFLEYAIMKGNLSIVRKLIGAGANINTRNKDGKTPLRVSVEVGNVNIVSELLVNGANPMLVDADGNNVLHIAAIMGKEDICRILIETGRVHDRVANKLGSIPLHLAALSENMSLGTYFFEMGQRTGSYRTVDKYGIQPLHLAALSGNIDLVTRILGADASLKQAKTSNGSTPLHFLCLGQCRSSNTLPDAGTYDHVLKLVDFISNTSKVNFQLIFNEFASPCVEAFDLNGLLPLHYAVWSDNIKAIQTMLSLQPGAFIEEIATGAYINKTAIDIMIVLNRHEMLAEVWDTCRILSATEPDEEDSEYKDILRYMGAQPNIQDVSLLRKSIECGNASAINLMVMQQMDDQNFSEVLLPGIDQLQDIDLGDNQGVYSAALMHKNYKLIKRALICQIKPLEIDGDVFNLNATIQWLINQDDYFKKYDKLADSRGYDALVRLCDSSNPNLQIKNINESSIVQCDENRFSILGLAVDLSVDELVVALLNEYPSIANSAIDILGNMPLHLAANN